MSQPLLNSWVFVSEQEVSGKNGRIEERKEEREGWREGGNENSKQVATVNIQFSIPSLLEAIIFHYL
jgi:hypothetical protein